MKDPCIRKILRESELAHFLLDPESVVIEELNLPITKSRIDIAVVNGKLHGYEIKSASDTLLRLPHQLMGYSKVFDLISVVTESKYHKRILDSIPEWVGLIICEKNKVHSTTVVRPAIQNQSQDGFYLSKLLWHNELLDIASKLSVPHRKSDRNWLLCEAIAQHVDIETISSLVRAKLKERTNWKNTKEGGYSYF